MHESTQSDRSTSPSPDVDLETADRAEIIEDLQRHTPEGMDVQPRTRRRTLRVMIPLALAALAIMVVAFVFGGGWAAAGLALVLVSMFYVIGWSPEWIAGLLRAKETREIEAIADQEVAHTSTSSDPASQTPTR